MARKIVRSAKTGKFVEKRMAKEQPDTTISQTLHQLTGRMATAIAKRASINLGREVGVAVVLAVHRAEQELTRRPGRKGAAA